MNREEVAKSGDTQAPPRCSTAESAKGTDTHAVLPTVEFVRPRDYGLDHVLESRAISAVTSAVLASNAPKPPKVFNDYFMMDQPAYAARRPIPVSLPFEAQAIVREGAAPEEIRAPVRALMQRIRSLSELSTRTVNAPAWAEAFVQAESLKAVSELQRDLQQIDERRFVETTPEIRAAIRYYAEGLRAIIMTSSNGNPTGMHVAAGIAAFEVGLWESKDLPVTQSKEGARAANYMIGDAVFRFVKAVSLELVTSLISSLPESSGAGLLRDLRSINENYGRPFARLGDKIIDSRWAAMRTTCRRLTGTVKILEQSATTLSLRPRVDETVRTMLELLEDRAKGESPYASTGLVFPSGTACLIVPSSRGDDRAILYASSQSMGAPTIVLCDPKTRDPHKLVGVIRTNTSGHSVLCSMTASGGFGLAPEPFIGAGQSVMGPLGDDRLNPPDVWNDTRTECRQIGDKLNKRLIEWWEQLPDLFGEMDVTDSCLIVDDPTDPLVCVPRFNGRVFSCPIGAVPVDSNAVSRILATYGIEVSEALAGFRFPSLVKCDDLQEEADTSGASVVSLSETVSPRDSLLAALRQRGGKISFRRLESVLTREFGIFSESGHGSHEHFVRCLDDCTFRWTSSRNMRGDRVLMTPTLIMQALTSLKVPLAEFAEKLSSS